MRKTFWVPLLMASIMTGQQARHVDDSVLRNTAKSGEEWLTYGQNPGETRYSPLRQIDATNVSRLGLAWSYDVGQGGGNQEATPLVWNGTLYAITNWSVVFALDARSGKERWRWDPEVNQTASRSKICCGIVNRGIAKGEVIVGVSGSEYPVRGFFDAYDAETGKFAWRFYTVPGDPAKGFESEAMAKAARTWGGDCGK